VRPGVNTRTNTNGMHKGSAHHAIQGQPTSCPGTGQCLCTRLLNMCHTFCCMHIMHARARAHTHTPTHTTHVCRVTATKSLYSRACMKPFVMGPLSTPGRRTRSPSTRSCSSARAWIERCAVCEGLWGGKAYAWA